MQVRIIARAIGTWDNGKKSFIIHDAQQTPEQKETFYKYLSLMRDAQVENYLSCEVPYTDIIEGRIYDIDPDKQVEIKDYYNVLELNENKDVIKKTVFYRVPTSIINQ